MTIRLPVTRPHMGPWSFWRDRKGLLTKAEHLPLPSLLMVKANSGNASKLMARLDRNPKAT